MIKNCRRVQLFGFIVLAIFFLSSCALFQGDIKSFTQMTPKEKAAFFMATYNKIYDNTLSIAMNPNATPAQKEMVKQKKELLMKAWPAIKAYDFLVSQGGTPSPDMEDEILKWLDQLAIL